MIPFFISFLTCRSIFFRSRYNLSLWILALRQQLSVLKRKQHSNFSAICRFPIRESRGISYLATDSPPPVMLSSLLEIRYQHPIYY